MRRDIQTVELERARGRMEQRGEHLDGGGLAGAVRPQEREDSSPARTSNETSLTAMTLPNDFTMCWTRMIGRSLTGRILSSLSVRR